MLGRRNHLSSKPNHGLAGSPSGSSPKNRRLLKPVELVVSEEPVANVDHPLVGLDPLERKRQRLSRLAEILAAAARRIAADQAAKGKKGTHEN